MVLCVTRLLTALLLSALFFSACDTGGTGKPPGPTTFRVGTLLDLSGGWASLGKSSQAALEIAASEINTAWETANSPLRVEVRVRDTGLNPQTALQQLHQFKAEGIHVVIGPQSSAEVAALQNYAKQNGILLISQGSTAHALAAQDDTVFRFCSDDIVEGQAVAALMARDHVSVVVPIWRTDAGNQGLHDSMTQAVPAAGGSVLAGVSYPASTTDFTPILTALATQVQQAITDNGTAKVGVYVAGFVEVADLLALAKNNAVLAAVKWYGSNGVVQNAALLDNTDAAQFAVTAGFPCPAFGLPPSQQASWQPLLTTIKDRTGLTADAYALAAYDALKVAARAFAIAGDDNALAYRVTFIAQANAYTGVTGPTTLNAAGDRQVADVDFWTIRPSGAGYIWDLSARYVNGIITPVP